MGLLGAYVVRLKCDGAKHHGPRPFKEFYADNLPHGLKMARLFGWKYDHRSDTATCPDCNLRGTLKVVGGKRGK